MAGPCEARVSGLVFSAIAISTPCARRCAGRALATRVDLTVARVRFTRGSPRALRADMPLPLETPPLSP